MDALDRALRRVEVSEDGRWIWTGATVTGYGTIGRGGRGQGNALVHRLVYERLIGPIPPKFDIDHLCRVTRCCNPGHLEPVTRTENARRGLKWRTHCRQGHDLDISGVPCTAGGRRCKWCRRKPNGMDARISS